MRILLVIGFLLLGLLAACHPYNAEHPDEYRDYWSNPLHGSHYHN